MSFEKNTENLLKKKSKLDRLQKRVTRKLGILSVLRIGIFLLLILWPILVYISRTPHSYFYLPEPFLIGAFLFLVIIFRKYEIFKVRLGCFGEVLEREGNRQNLNIGKMYSGDPEISALIDQNHFSKDLDIFGARGFYTYLDTTFTKKGEGDFLKDLLLLNQAKIEEISARQKLIKKLSSNKYFTARFLRMFHEAKAGILEINSKIDLSPLTGKAGYFYRKRIFLKYGFRILAVASWISLLVNVLTDLYMFTSFFFLIQLALFIYFRNSILLFFKPYENFSENINALKKLCKYSIRINRKFELVIDSENWNIAGAERAFSELNSMVQKISVSNSPSAHLLLNLFFLWDFWILLRLDKWNLEYNSQVRLLIENLEFLDSVLPFAHFAVTNSDYVYPEISEENELHFEKIQHPLIPRDLRVPNDLGKVPVGSTVLITGSNMSGKTTFLRTIGVNIILAMNGAPVPARKISMPPLSILSSIRNEDSLVDGVSFFYSEVKRISAILKKVRDASIVHIVLLDELLKGTNSRERLIASKAILKELEKQRTMSFITTHDIDLAKNNSKLILKYFSEIILDNKMSFDYKIRDGIVKAGNALKILELEGLNLEFEPE
ncbi:MAG: hypothetical protein K8R21_14210 [Leptospira sp.]|nr:hypothetical protein [Leptospira sp.]